MRAGGQYPRIFAAVAAGALDERSQGRPWKPFLSSAVPPPVRSLWRVARPAMVAAGGKLLGYFMFTAGSLAMKRGFLFGLGSLLILSVITELARLSAIDAILALILMPVSAIVIRAANRAPPSRSRLHGVGGWLLGFFGPSAVILGAVGIILVFR